MKTVFLLDFENVNPKDVDLIKQDASVILFIGQKQSKIAIETATLLQPLGRQVEYIKISGHGKNAADFHIAYFLGKLSQQDKRSEYVIVSKDNGFDPLIKYMTGEKINCKKVAGFREYYVVAKEITPGTNYLTELKSFLETHKNRPATVKTMKSFIKSQYKELKEDAAIDALYNELLKLKVFSVNKTKIVYKN
jgi:hypothetical protein